MKTHKIVVGLGNYGDKYAYTYHNMGFLAIDCLADKLGIELKLKQKLYGKVAEFVDKDGNKIVLAQPWTYMNLSGMCVSSLMHYYKVGLDSLIVIYDDIDIEIGTTRARQRGSAGTHNGMRHIVSTLGSSDFARIRIGIGKPPERVPLADWVTSEITKEQRQVLANAIEESTDIVQKWIVGELFDK
ncbi:MAG: aminoacyl-tRNA hydrolase [Firmicutes bacterium]|nr:aminoacyl-tRNA hydrolase [Bacillota bacterium]MCL1953767.1 aminoacyl-tRNA hydrolase [Bacillota bacterium]